MTPRARIALLLAAAAVLVIAFVIAQGSGDDDGGGTDAAATQTTAAPAQGGGTGQSTAESPTTVTEPAAEPATPVIRIVGGKPQGGVAKLKYKKGDQIRFTVQSDVADEIHVHGYDLHKDVEKGGEATFAFPATIEGRFEAELEDHGVQILQFEVQP